MNFKELLSSLGMETRLDLSEAVQAGGCSIQFDKNLELVLESDENAGIVQMYIEVAKAPATGRESFFAALLQLHLFGLATDGGTFGFDPAQERVLFFKTLPLSLLEPQEALGHIERFVNQAERWRTHLPAATAKAQEAASTNATSITAQRA